MFIESAFAYTFVAIEFPTTNGSLCMRIILKVTNSTLSVSVFYLCLLNL